MTNVVGIALHKEMKLIDGCAEVLNEEWPRSHTARVHMLGKSADTLPYCIVLCIEPEHKVIGHARLCLVHGVEQACFIDSVVVSKSHRGKGLGLKLMTCAEEHALMLGYHHLYLTTHDKQHFYEHCGYQYCEPVVSFGSGSKLLTQEQLAKLFGDTKINKSNTRVAEKSQNRAASLLPTSVTIPPPPPPPPPAVQSVKSSAITRLEKIYWMTKTLDIT